MLLKLLSLALQFVNKFTLRSFNRNFGIFSFLFFGNSPLFPAKCERKSTQNTSQIIPKDSANERNASLLAGYTASAAYLIKIKFKQLLTFIYSNSITGLHRFSDAARIYILRQRIIVAIIKHNHYLCALRHILPATQPNKQNN